MEPPSGRSEGIKWPAANNKEWEEFDGIVVGKLKDLQKGTFQDRMVLHCNVIYEVGRERFGCKEGSSGGGKMVPPLAGVKGSSGRQPTTKNGRI